MSNSKENEKPPKPIPPKQPVTEGYKPPPLPKPSDKSKDIKPSK